MKIKPFINYSRECVVGDVMEVRLSIEVSDVENWDCDDVEYQMYFNVEGDAFTTRYSDDPRIIITKDGGIFDGPCARLTAVRSIINGEVRVSIINKWGVTVKCIGLNVSVFS